MGDVFVDGERVMPAEEVAKELGLSVDEVRQHGADWSFPSVRVAGTFYGCRRDHVEVWRRMLAPVKVEPVAQVRSGSLINGQFVEDSWQDAG